MIFTKGNIVASKIARYFSFENSERKIFVVPTNRKARRLKKEFISAGENFFNIETLGTLATKLLAEHKAFQPLDDAVGAYLLEKTANKIKPKYFTRFRGGFPKGTLERIKSVISEYKRQGISPEILLQEVREADLDAGEINKAEDIAEIFSRYSQKCRELNALEIGDIYFDLLALSVAEFSEIFRKVFPNIETLLLRDFTELAASEIELLNKISACGVGVAVYFDYEENNSALFETLDKTFEKLGEAGFQKNESSFGEKNGLQKHLAENLFKVTVKTKREADNVFIFAGRNTFEEIENTAKIIKDLISREKTPPHKIAVVSNLISEYSPLVRTVFDEYGIPFNLSDRLTLEKAPVVKSLLSLLETKKTDFYYRTLFTAINSGYAQALVENPYNLQRFAQNHSIISAEKIWRKRFEEISAKADFSEREKREFEQARNDFERLASALSAFNGKYTPDEFVKKLKSLVLRLNVTEKLLAINSRKAEENITALSVLFEKLSAVLELVKRDDEIEERQSFSFYFDVVSSVAKWARFNVKERSDYGVLVTAAEELRGLKFDYVFFCGLNDGVLPLKYSPEIFFAKNFITKEEEKLAEQRFIFFNVFNAFEKRIYLSYAKTSDKTELSKSVFLEDLGKTIHAKEIEKDFFSRKLYSQRELQIQFASNKNLFSEKERKEIERKKSAYESRKENVKNDFNGHFKEDDETVSEYLKRFSQRTFSVTQFESYAACPFKYFLERILRLEALDEPEKEIEPILIGNFLHEVLFEFYTTLRDKKIDIASEEAETLLFSIANDLYGKYGFDDETYFFEKEKFFGVNGNKFDSVLYKFLSEERKNREFEPAFFEVSFGRKLDEAEKTDRLLSVENAANLGDVKLSGKIDRIDLNENGFKLIDYKSGRKGTNFQSIMNGLSLQLPIYMKIVEGLLQRKKETSGKSRPLKMGIYKLKFGEDDFGFTEIKNRSKTLAEEDLRNLSEIAEKFLMFYFNEIRSGNFSPLENDACRYCEFRSVCRVDEREEETVTSDA